MFQNSSTQILECVLRNLPGPRVAYNAGLHKGCFYKMLQFQRRKNSLALLTHSL